MQRFTKDLASVVTSNILVLLGGIFTGFIVPKLLGVDEYGVFKVFSLYLTYGALLHFGYVDGVLLRYAGASYYELDKERFRAYSRFFIYFEILIGIIVFLCAQFLFSGDNRIVLSLLAFDVVALNITSYYQYVSQSTMRFKELSRRKILLTLMKIAALLVLMGLVAAKIISQVKAVHYVGVLVFIDTFLAIWYIFTYRDITLGRRVSFGICGSDIRGFFSNGIILTLSFQAATIIFTLDRQFVSLLYDNRTYSIYAFAYTLISMVTSVVGAASLVLLPTLRKLKATDAMKYFSTSVSTISMVAFFSMVGYQPLCFIIERILPEYIHSMVYLRIIFPGLALTSSITIIMYTYYKVLNAHKVYFRICCLVMIVSIMLNYGAYRLFGTPESISLASIFASILWYLVALSYFVKTYHVKWIKNFVYTLLAMALFYLSTMISSMLVAWMVYAILFCLLTGFFYKGIVLQFVKKLIKR